MSDNRLAQETSPYLLQHADNPVAWRAWGEEAFAEARSARKPVLLSVGYAACHWCHVMAHESFEDPDVAAVMNELFVNIKVDREERPDVDTIYQHALALLGQQGGWPLTLFLTPEGEPFWGGTYFPKEARWGRPGFVDVLRSVAGAFHSDHENVAKNVKALEEGLARLAQPRPGRAEIGSQILDEVARRFARQVDPFHGGTGDAPKFPQPPIFKLLWRAWKRTADPVHRHAVHHTLAHLCQGGIYDHLGGGFARYSVDDRWLVPHFEKMLYDNAQLVELLTWAWQDTGKPLYERRVRETIGWLLREMVAPEEADGLAGFAATLDADSEGEEGRFYVWTLDEIRQVLGDDAERFAKAYLVKPHGNWESKTILNRLHDLDPDPAEDEALEPLRRRLFETRAKRVPPARDDKVLTDWNGLMIAALARAGRAFAEPDWVHAATRAFDHVATHLAAGDGRLMHSRRLGRSRHPGTLDDHAAMIRAGIALHESTGEQRFLDQAIAWSDAVERHFTDPDGAYRTAAHDTPLLVTTLRHANDNAVPSGNGLMADALAHLYYLTGDTRWRERAESIVTAFSGELERNFVPLPTLLNAAETLERGLQVVVVDAGDGRADALLRAVDAQSLPDLVLARVPAGADLPAGHPVAGKTGAGAGSRAFVCEGPVCSLPLDDPATLAADLRARSAGQPETPLPGEDR